MPRSQRVVRHTARRYRLDVSSQCLCCPSCRFGSWLGGCVWQVSVIDVQQRVVRSGLQKVHSWNSAARRHCVASRPNAKAVRCSAVTPQTPSRVLRGLAHFLNLISVAWTCSFLLRGLAHFCSALLVHCIRRHCKHHTDKRRVAGLVEHPG